MDLSAIKKIRLQKGLSQKDLAEKLSVSGAYIQQIESNKKNPSMKTLSKLADALDVPVNELLDPMYLFNGTGALKSAINNIKIYQDYITNGTPFKSDDFINTSYGKYESEEFKKLLVSKILNDEFKESEVIYTLLSEINCNSDLLTKEERKDLFKKLIDFTQYEVYKLEKEKGIKLINEG